MAKELSLYVLGPELLYFISEYLTPTCLKCYITHMQMSDLKHTSIQTWQKEINMDFYLIQNRKSVTATKFRLKQNKLLLDKFEEKILVIWR